MSRQRRVCLAVFAILLASPLPAPAQESPFSQSSVIGYWPAHVSFAGPGGTVTWTSTILVLDYQTQHRSSPLGFRLRYAVGRQGSWSFAGASGHDTIWSADVTYAWGSGGLFAGYGSTTWENTDSAGMRLIESTAGVRLGAEVVVPLAPNWSAHAGGVWSPLARTTVTSPAVFSTDTAFGSVLEYGVSLRYGPGSWFVEAGYRGLTTRYGTLAGGAFAGGCPCSTSWRGFTLGFGGRF